MNPFSTRKRNIFNPDDDKPFELSRSKIQMFKDCPRCFYLDRRLGVNQPASFALNINNAIDLLFKKEFDKYRKEQKPHPIMTENNVDAIPFQHAKLDEWRDPFKGVRYHHEPSNFIVFGGVDDIWVNPKEELIVVDYKSTSTDYPIALNKPWHQSYKNQIDVYQWLFKMNEFPVCKTGYFVYANALKDKDEFNNILDFETTLLSYDGDVSWIESTLLDIKETLTSDEIPPSNSECDFCKYREAAGKSFRHHLE